MIKPVHRSQTHGKKGALAFRILNPRCCCCFLLAVLDRPLSGGASPRAVRADECEEWRLWNTDDNVSAVRLVSYDAAEDAVFCKPTSWKEFNVEAAVYYCGPAASMKFTLTNYDTGFTFTRLERKSPFFAFGNRGEDYSRINGRDLEPGQYKVSMVAYLDETSDEPGGTYGSSVEFTVVDEDSGVPCEKI